MNTNASKPLDLAQLDGHTPGPWHYNGSERTTASWVYSSYSKAGRVCNLTASDSDSNNGRLIAAAPALLSECRRQREQIKALREALAAIQSARDCNGNGSLTLDAAIKGSRQIFNYALKATQ